MMSLARIARYVDCSIALVLCHSPPCCATLRGGWQVRCLLYSHVSSCLCLFVCVVCHTQVTVILTHMFRPLELASELGAAAELETEVMEESKKIGPVDKVRVYMLVCLCGCVTTCRRAHRDGPCAIAPTCMYTYTMHVCVVVLTCLPQCTPVCLSTAGACVHAH